MPPPRPQNKAAITNTYSGFACVGGVGLAYGALEPAFLHDVAPVAVATRSSDQPNIQPVTGTPVDLLNAGRRAKRVLLLQGPVGPFFSELHTSLLASGCSVTRVVFNAGDKFFAGQPDCVHFSGTLVQWDSWLRFKLGSNSFDAIVLFGSSRPLHKVARYLAALFNVDVISLEEGYLRSGFVSCELGGNNQHSPLINWTAGSAASDTAASELEPVKLKSSFMTMSMWGTAYYLSRDLLSDPIAEDLFHRPRERVLSLSVGWCAHMARRAVSRVLEAPLKRKLHRNPGYIIVPLQVSHDSQIQKASRGWTGTKLIDACLTALARSHPQQTVVFKLHPLERGNRKIKRLIHQRARALGLSRTQFKILHTGRIGDLTAQSSGMIIINSTSAFSALHHGVPLLVLGDAVFRHDAIVTVGENQSDITDFFKTRRAKSPQKVAEFFNAVKAQSLIPGDFYVSAGRSVAIKNILRKLDDLPVARSVTGEIAT